MPDVDPGESPIQAKSTVSIILDSQPSCLEFAESRDLLVVGTYNLEDKGACHESDESSETRTQKRTGSLLVFRITKEVVTLLQTENLPYAVLDLHFSPCDPSVFAVATSVGSVCFFSIDFEHDGSLTLVNSVQVCDPSILVLSLSFERLGSGPNKTSPLMAASLSDGYLAICSAGEDISSIVRVRAHEQEAWTVIWAMPSSHQAGSEEPIRQYLLSGGDDSMLAKHTAIFSAADAILAQHEPCSQDVKTHSAGVTAILPINGCDEVIVTGSYDEYIRVLIPPSCGRGTARVLAEKHLGGGVWRLSRLFSEQRDQHANITKFNVLASCMHAGARVVQIEQLAGMWSIKVIAEFTEHESMNYASDSTRRKESQFFVSTSFYDRKLCVWTL